MPKIIQPPHSCTNHRVLLQANEDLKLQILAANLKEQLAEDIPFTEDYRVTKAIGNFKVGDSVKDLSINQILAKLLGLTINTSDNNPPVIDPDSPDANDPTGPIQPDNAIVTQILAEELPMYGINEAGELEEAKYQILILTEAEEMKKPDKSGFYQIIDGENQVIESGYQYLSANNPDGPFILALPSFVDISEIAIETYNALAGKDEDPWVSYNSLNLTNDFDAITAVCEEIGWSLPEIDRTNYTIWADLEQPASGAAFRFIIE